MSLMEGDRSSLEWRWQKPSTSICTLFTHSFEVPPAVFMSREDGMPVLDNLSLCENEVYKELSIELDSRKAPGPDGLPTIVLKLCARELSPSLCALFIYLSRRVNCLSDGKIPLLSTFLRKAKRRM